MRITRQLEDLRMETKPVVLAVGSFDGVHRGHQEIFAESVRKARANKGEAWALTLDPHPLKVLKPDVAPPLLTSTEHKLRLMEQYGMDGCIVLPFTPELAAEEPEAFLARLNQNIPRLSELVVGANWTFGHRARGNVALAREQAPAHGFHATVVDPVLWGGKPLSSTRIRQAVSQGDLAEAEEMLGRPFSIFGTVVSGRQVGTRLGFPTANLDPHNEVRPPSGVYAVRVILGERPYNGAAFLADTEGAKQSPSGYIVEVYIFDFDADIYGRDVEAVFVRRTRDVRRFETLRLLKEQIARDVTHIRELFDELDG